MDTRTHIEVGGDDGVTVFEIGPHQPDPFEIPAFCRLSPAQRAEAWRSNPPKQMTVSEAQRETDRLYRWSKQRDRDIELERTRKQREAFFARKAQEKAEIEAVRAEAARAHKKSKRRPRR